MCRLKLTALGLVFVGQIAAIVAPVADEQFQNAPLYCHTSKLPGLAHV